MSSNKVSIKKQHERRASVQEGSLEIAGIKLVFHEAAGDRPSLSRGWWFDFGFFILKRVQPDYDWVVYERASNELNDVVSDSNRVGEMESLFKTELGDEFADVHLVQLALADVTLLAYDKESGKIRSYVSGFRSAVGTIPGVQLAVTHGGLAVVQREHQRKKLGVLSSALVTLFGRRLRDFFREEVIVMRTNNRHVLRVQENGGSLFRSDRLSEFNDASTLEETMRRIVVYTHKHLFMLPEDTLYFDRPMQVSHKFENGLAIPGLEENEIIYTCSVSNLFTFLRRIVSR